jgi:hypothetical protein
VTILKARIASQDLARQFGVGSVRVEGLAVLDIISAAADGPTPVLAVNTVLEAIVRDNEREIRDRDAAHRALVEARAAWVSAEIAATVVEATRLRDKLRHLEAELPRATHAADTAQRLFLRGDAVAVTTPAHDRLSRLRQDRDAVEGGLERLELRRIVVGRVQRARVADRASGARLRVLIRHAPYRAP